MTPTLQKQSRATQDKILWLSLLLTVASIGILYYYHLISLSWAIGLLASGIIGLFLILSLIYSLIHAKEVEQSVARDGISARAMILGVNLAMDDDTSSVTFDLRLNVFIEGETPFQEGLTLTSSQYQAGSYQPGDVMPVKVGRIRSSKTNEVVRNIVTLDPMAGNQRALSFWKNQEEFENWLSQRNEEIDEMFRIGTLAKAKVISFKSLGTFVAGVHPVVELEVEVQPEGDPTFLGSLRSVLQETSVLKFQPGNEIWVKFDPAKHSRIVLVGSTPTPNILLKPTSDVLPS